MLPRSGLSRSDLVPWPDADLVQRQLLRRLLGVEQTGYAQREFFRVWPEADLLQSPPLTFARSGRRYPRLQSREEKSMAGAREYSSNPSRRAVVGAGGALLGANLLSSPAKAALAQLKLPDKAPETPPLARAEIDKLDNRRKQKGDVPSGGIKRSAARGPPCCRRRPYAGCAEPV